MGLLGQDMTTFTFRHNPIPEKISFCRIEKISFLWKSPRHCLTLELKLKKFYPIIKMTTLKDFEAYLREMYVTLKLDDSGYRVHSVSDGNEEIVTDKRYVVMPWKMVTRHSKNLILKEVAEEIKACEEDRRLVSKFETEHRDEISEILGLIDYIDKGYVEEKFSEIYNFGPERLGMHLKDKLVLEEYSSGCPIDRRFCQLDYFKKTIKAYQGLDSDAVKYVEKVKELIDKPFDELELEDIRLARKKVKFPRKLDISVFYQLTGRLPHEGLEFKEEDFIVHFYDTFVAVSIKLLGKTVRCGINVLYHLLKKTGNEPNADMFPFMKENSHQRAEEEIKFIFENLGWSYSPLCGTQGPPVPAPPLASKVSLSP